MRRECKISVHKGGVIEVVGDLTASAEKDMDAAYKKVCNKDSGGITLKFDGKSRINSAGIAIVINLVMESREKDCKVFITGVSKHFKKIFELVGLTKYTTVVDIEEEAGK